MNKRTTHATKHAKGSIKEAIGMLMGNPTAQAEGAAEKAESLRQADAMDPVEGKASPHS